MQAEASCFDAFMDAAVALAEQGRFSACPNPVVGAVLVRDGRIAAEGFHNACGQAHAEVECLRDAARKGVDPGLCTMVVTLEPCRHHGKTPPCTDAILAAGIRRVVVGLADPNPEAGGGAALLREKGVEVVTGIRERACRDLVADFFAWRRERRPYLILKMASTLDGRIATRTGHAQWISGESSRASVHMLRARIGARGGVLIGGNTLYDDNPRLTARVAGVDAGRPFACVVTSRLPSPREDLHLVRDRIEECVFFCAEEGAGSGRAKALRAAGARVYGLAPARRGEGLDLGAGLRLLFQDFGCLYVLCEGGGKLALSLLEQGLADEFRLHLAPRILGDGRARPLFDGRAPVRMDEARGMRVSALSMCGEDIHITLRPET